VTNGVIVTGSSGFIGSHLCRLLTESAEHRAFRGIDRVPAADGARHPTELVDIADLSQLQGLATPADTVFHLAAKAEVVIPFGAIPDLNATNVAGTVHVLKAYAPKRFIFASSSAVYGNGARPRVDTSWCNVNPLGTYGMSKATGELACADWARETGGTAMMFRLGNVIGPRCRGLIPHLVRHARNHPAGTVPVRMRGEGQITRDYVPVQHVAEIFKRASMREWPGGVAHAFNIGTGRGMTNGEVAQIVADVLHAEGFELRIDPTAPLEAGEAEHVVLDIGKTTSAFDLDAPSVESVHSAISAAVISWLQASEAVAV
jgi:nucleoside-diphosphate-sugar epimerase